MNKMIQSLLSATKMKLRNVQFTYQNVHPGDILEGYFIVFWKICHLQRPKKKKEEKNCKTSHTYQLLCCFTQHFSIFIHIMIFHSWFPFVIKAISKNKVIIQIFWTPNSVTEVLETWSEFQFPSVVLEFPSCTIFSLVLTYN